MRVVVFFAVVTCLAGAMLNAALPAVSVDIHREAPDSSSNPAPFIATDEWQTIQEGQAIPPGLHVQIDMQTGAKQARLMPVDERVGVQTLSEKRRATLNALQPLLAPLADADALGDSDQRVVDLATEVKAAKQAAKGVAGSNPAADATLAAASLFAKALHIAEDAAASEEARVAALREVEEEVRKVELGQDFAALGGFVVLARLLHPEPPFSPNSVRMAALSVCAAAASNNPLVQDKAAGTTGLMSGIAHFLHRLSVTAIRHALVALGAILRNNAASHELLNSIYTANFTLAHDLVSLTMSTTATIAAKAVALLADLAVEQALHLDSELANKSFHGVALLTEAARSVPQIPLIGVLRASPLCPGLSHLAGLQGLAHKEAALKAWLLFGNGDPCALSADLRRTLTSDAHEWIASGDEYALELANLAQLVLDRGAGSRVAPATTRPVQHHAPDL